MKNIKYEKAECRRMDAFELCCWRRLLRVPWTARRSNQSILKEINPEYSLEGLMRKLKLQYSEHLMWRADSLKKTLMLGKIEGKKRRGWQRVRWLDGITAQWKWIWANFGRQSGQGRLACCSSWGHRESDATCGWTTANGKNSRDKGYSRFVLDFVEMPLEFHIK